MTAHVSKEQRAVEAAWCLEQRIAARTFRQISAGSEEALGRHLPLTTVYKRYAWAMDKTIREPAETVRALELERLDVQESRALMVQLRDHYKVNGSAIVKDDDGNPLIDDAPVLAALDRLLKIQERRARLLGLDQPEKQAVTTTVRYEVVGVDVAALT